MMRVISSIVLVSALLARGAQDDDSLQKGIAEFNRGRYAAAETWLEKAPDGGQRRTFLALTRAAIGRCDEAQQQLADEFAKSEDAVLRRLAGLALTQCQLSQGRYDDTVPV